jgi:hypothetical protein
LASSFRGPPTPNPDRYLSNNIDDPIEEIDWESACWRNDVERQNYPG